MKGEVRVRIALGLMCSALVLAGCAAETAGEAAPQGKAAGEPVFSPCDDIPDQAIVGIGMDPATESRDIFDVHQPGWSICGWNSDQYSLSVFSTVRSLDELSQNDDYTEFEPVQVGDRDAVVFRSVSYPPTQRSYLAVGTAEGMVMASITDWDEDPTKEPPKQVVVATMQALLPYLPQ
ncbi:DUF3558 domain-containing protein [Rhodococcus hoagii]|nr:DUF3558 domain-containing protein [Prescottella equi]